MNIDLELQGQDTDETSLLALQDWLRRSGIEGLQVDRKSIPPAEGQMGADIVAILSVVLGSAAVVELVRSLHTWVKLRRRNVKIKLNVKGTQLEIDAQNLIDETALIKSAEKLIRAAKS